MPLDRLIVSHFWQEPLLWALIVYIVLLLCVALILVGFTLRLRHQNEKKAELWQSLEARWEPLLMAVIGQQAWPDKLHAAVKAHETFYFVDFLMRYAEKLTGGAYDTLCQLAQPYLAGIAQRAHQGDTEQRARAILTLNALSPQAYQQVIVQGLDDPAPLVVMLTASALAEQHQARYLSVILEKIARFETWSQNYLINLLVQLGREATERLREEVMNAQHPAWVRVVLLKALGELHDWQALPLAEQILAVASERDLQAAALYLLGRLGHAEHAALVRQKVRSSDFVIRLHAVKALERLATAKDEALLSELVNDESLWIARHAMEALKTARLFEVLYGLAHAEHPRHLLAQQVLYDFESVEALSFLVTRAAFADDTRRWLMELSHKNHPLGWKRLQTVLRVTMHPDVKTAIETYWPPNAPPQAEEARLQLRQLTVEI
ncbi:MAG: HEAT repeat domain-containing protein [Candidatus Sericytochromatia bacterium]|nr:HEAT repeat domain-containing protein [Candidatus Sericytochromatia bacterium]